TTYGGRGIELGKYLAAACTDPWDESIVLRDERRCRQVVPCSYSGQCEGGSPGPGTWFGMSPRQYQRDSTASPVTETRRSPESEPPRGMPTAPVTTSVSEPSVPPALRWSCPAKTECTPA